MVSIIVVAKDQLENIIKNIIWNIRNNTNIK